MAEPSKSPQAGRNEERVLLLTPASEDPSPIRDMLAQASIPGDVCNSLEDLSLQMKDGAGVGLIAEETLHSSGVDTLFAELKTQPVWSDLPFVLLTAAGSSLGEKSAHLMEVFGESANITILERPVRASTLLSVIRTALRARRRQYEVRDYIRERQRIEDDLRQTQKLESIGVLAGGVAHDFNNLLVGILGNTSLAQSMLPAESPAQPLLEDVILAGQRAADLTRRLLSYAGKGRFVLQPLNLSKLVREMNALVRPSIPKLVRLRLDLDANLPAIQGDPSQLQQLIMNLVINGAEAVGGKAGNVVVTTSLREVAGTDIPRAIPPTDIHPGRYVCLEVRDDGSGMDAETTARIFDPFFTTKLAGRGLGLAAALGIVRGHQGGIQVDSAPGQGATFRVYLPAMDGNSA